MNAFEAAAMAVVQGLTEFLPVSSSGHLALASGVLRVPEGGLAFDIVLHLGTLLAVLVFYGRDLIAIASGSIRRERKSLILLGTIAAATVPVALFGILAGDFIEGLFRNFYFVSAALAFTGAVLFFAGESPPDRKPGVSFRQGMTVGLFQTLALFPGVSRSGMTICAGLRAGLSREEAARFSFLLSVPAIAGAAVKELPGAEWSMAPSVLLTGFAVSAAVGFAALALLVRFVKKGRIRGFAWYCWGVSIFGLILAVSNGGM